MLSSHLPAKFALAVQIQVAKLSGRLLYLSPASLEFSQEIEIAKREASLKRENNDHNQGDFFISCEILPSNLKIEVNDPII